MAITAHSHELALLDDLDRPPLPLDFPDYRDLTVIVSSGQELGRLSDMVFDMETRKPLLVVVLFGGLLDMGAKHILLPFNWLHDATASHVHADFTMAQAAASPDVNPRDLKQFEPYVRTWFPPEAEAFANPGMSPVPTGTHHHAGPLVRVSRAAAWQIPDVVPDLRGKDVVNAEGQTLGAVDDWFYSPRLHAPAIVVIKRGGILGLFAHEAMVPYERLKLLENGSLQAAISPEELRYAPELRDDILDYGPYYEYWEAADSGEVIIPPPQDEPRQGAGTYVSPDIGSGQ